METFLGGVHSPSPSSAPTTGNSRANSTNHTATKRDNVYRKESPIHIPTAPHPDATTSANTSSASLPDTLPDVMSPSPGVTLHEYAEDLPYVPELGEQALDSDHDVIYYIYSVLQCPSFHLNCNIMICSNDFTISLI